MQELKNAYLVRLAEVEHEIIKHYTRGINNPGWNLKFFTPPNFSKTYLLPFEKLTNSQLWQHQFENMDSNFFYQIHFNWTIIIGLLNNKFADIYAREACLSHWWQTAGLISESQTF